MPAPGSCSASTSSAPLTSGLSTAMSKSPSGPATADAGVCAAREPPHRGPEVCGSQSTPRGFYRCPQRPRSQTKQQAVGTGCIFPHFTERRNRDAEK